MSHPKLRPFPYELVIKHRPREGWMFSIEQALLDLEVDRATVGVQSGRHYAERWRRSRPWVAERLAEHELSSWAATGRPPKQKSLGFPTPSKEQTPSDTQGSAGRKRGKKTPPPDELSAADMGRLQTWIKMHKRPEVRMMESDLDLMVERCLAWHRGHDTRHASWYAAAQTWILKEPKKGSPRATTTRSDEWDREASKL